VSTGLGQQGSVVREVVIVEAARTPVGRGSKEKGYYATFTRRSCWERATAP